MQLRKMAARHPRVTAPSRPPTFRHRLIDARRPWPPERRKGLAFNAVQTHREISVGAAMIGRRHEGRFRSERSPATPGIGDAKHGGMKTILSSTLGFFLGAACVSAQNNPDPQLTLDGNRGGDIGADGRRFGAGAMVGEPTGASLKYWMTPRAALDGGLGTSFHGKDSFHIHADYLYHLFDLIPVESGRLPVYFGGGLRGKIRDNRDDVMGFRAVAGLNYLFEDEPVDVFFEAGPVFDVTPDTDVNYTVAVGARYWF